MPSPTGGRYTARENADGTIDIFDVPIVSELQKGERADLPDFEITGEWLQAALERANSRAAAGYLPPLHIHHHVDGPAKPRAGFFRPKRVGAFKLDEKPVQTLFADLLNIPKAVAARILRGELPYRSIEILNVNSSPEVDSLALLDSQPPQFRYPLLSIAKLIKQEDAVRPQLVASGCPTAAVAFQAFPKVGAAAATFNFPGDPAMSDALPADLPAAGTPPAFDEDAFAAKLASAVVAALGEAEAKKLAAAKEEEEKQKLAAAGHEEPDGDEDVKKLEAAEEVDETGKPKFVDPTINEGRLVAKAVKAIEVKFGGVLAEAKGEVAGLKAQLKARDEKDAARDAKETTASLLAAAKRELAPFHLDEDTLEKDLPEQAKLGKDCLDRFVAALKRNAPKDPAETFQAFLGMPSESDAPAVAKFHGSPAKLAVAREIEKRYHENKKRGMVNMTLERYIACNASLIEQAAAEAN